MLCWTFIRSADPPHSLASSSGSGRSRSSFGLCFHRCRSSGCFGRGLSQSAGVEPPGSSSSLAYHRFFRNQSLAFYNWCRHRLPVALQYAEKAWAASWQAEFFLVVHWPPISWVICRSTSDRFKREWLPWKKPISIFQVWGHCQHVQILETALAGYHLESKPFGSDALGNLRQHRHSLKPQLFPKFSLSGARSSAGSAWGFDWCRGSARRGWEFDPAFWASSPPGFLLFRKAYLAHLSGRDQTALQYLDDLDAFVRDDRNERLLIKVIGLKQAITARDSNAPPVPEFKNLRKVGYAVSRRIDARRLGQNRLQIGHKTPWAILWIVWNRRIFETGEDSAHFEVRHMSFLYNHLPISRQDRVMYFDLEPQSLFIFDQGDIQKSEGRQMTLQMQKFVRLLLDGANQGGPGRRDLGLYLPSSAS